MKPRMNRYSWLLLLLLFACGKNDEGVKSPPISNKTEEKKFFNQDGQFRILFEATPTAYSMDIPYENGTLRMHYFMYEKGVNLIYMISYTDYPEAYLQASSNADLFLESMLNDYITNEVASLDTRKKVMVNNQPGIFFQANNGRHFTYGEYILKGNRFYQITVVKENYYHNEAESMAFINSLELL